MTRTSIVKDDRSFRLPTQLHAGETIELQIYGASGLAQSKQFIERGANIFAPPPRPPQAAPNHIRPCSVCPVRKFAPEARGWAVYPGLSERAAPTAWTPTARCETGPAPRVDASTDLPRPLAETAIASTLCGGLRRGLGSISSRSGPQSSRTRRRSPASAHSTTPSRWWKRTQSRAAFH